MHKRLIAKLNKKYDKAVRKYVFSLGTKNEQKYFYIMKKYSDRLRRLENDYSGDETKDI